MKNEQKVVVSGAGGFLGKTLLMQLLNRGSDLIVAVTSKPLQSIMGDLPDSRMMEYRNRLKVVNAKDLQKIASELSDADVFVNCAFPRNVNGYEMARGLRYIENLFIYAKANQKCSIINISSQSVYSQKDSRPATEEDELCLETSYAVAKYATELLLESTCLNNNRTNLRLGSLIGPGFDQRVVNKMVRSYLRNKQIYVKDNGSEFGYLDVKDASQAVIALCKTAGISDWSSSYNVGAIRAYSLKEIADTVVRVCNEGDLCRGKESITVELVNGPGTHSSVNSDRFFKLTGWMPKISLEESIQNIFNNIKLSFSMHEE